MKRSERVKTYLSYAYEIVKENDDKEVYNRFYDFLIENRVDMDFISEEMFINFKVEIEDVIAHKNDMIMEIVKEFYSAIRFYMLSGDANEEEERLVNFIDAQQFTFVDIVQYFIHPEKEHIAKMMIEVYCLFKTQSNNFINQIKAYNNNKPTDFLNEVNEAVEYLDIIDEIADVYGSAFSDKTTDELDEEANNVDNYDNDEEDYPEDDEVFVSEKISETVQCFLQLLEKNYGDLQSEKMNKFLGYYLSLAYPLLLEQKEMRMPEAYYEKNQEILDLLENDELELEDILNNFYGDEDYLFAAIELISQEYLDSEGQDFDTRYRYEAIDEKGIIKKLDPSYVYDEYVEEIEISESENLQISGSIVDIMDMVIEKIKMQYPEDYKQKLYRFLLIENIDDGILYEFDIPDNFINYFKISMIRMLARKFFEYSNSRNISELTLEHLKIHRILESMELNLNAILELFHRYGEDFIDMYFILSKRSELAEKRTIRNIPNIARKRLVELDPSVTGDASYYKALMVGDLFILLEENGVDAVCNSFEKIQLEHPKRCRDLIMELLTELYYKMKKSEDLIDIDNLFLKYLENDSYTLEDYTIDLIRTKPFLKALLSRYLELQKQVEYPIENKSIIKDEIFDEKIKMRIFSRENK